MGCQPPQKPKLKFEPGKFEPDKFEPDKFGPDKFGKATVWKSQSF